MQIRNIENAKQIKKRVWYLQPRFAWTNGLKLEEIIVHFSKISEMFSTFDAAFLKFIYIMRHELFDLTSSKIFDRFWLEVGLYTVIETLAILPIWALSLSKHPTIIER